MKKCLVVNYKYYEKNDINFLKNCKEFKVTLKNFNSYEEFITYLTKNRSYEILFTTLGFEITNKILNKYLKKCKIIVTPTTGINHIKINTQINKLRIVSLRDCKREIEQINSTAEHAFLLILLSLKKTHETIIDVKKNNWNRNLFFSNDLKKKTVGIIGMGRIGKKIKKYLKAFETKIITCDRKDNKKNYTSTLNNLLKNSDIITIHINSENNKDFIDLNKLKKMKKNSILINTSRGEIINEKDLLKALKKKYIKFAALDVLKNDSSFKKKIKDNEVINYSKKSKNLIITPHVGGASLDGKKIASKAIINRLVHVVKNEKQYE